eukprot:739102-Pyramimonas_sp.AAC.2
MCRGAAAGRRPGRHPHEVAGRGSRQPPGPRSHECELRMRRGAAGAAPAPPGSQAAEPLEGGQGRGGAAPWPRPHGQGARGQCDSLERELARRAGSAGRRVVHAGGPHSEAGGGGGGRCSACPRDAAAPGPRAGWRAPPGCRTRARQLFSPGRGH